MKAENALPDFDGDNKDQRSWTHWMAEWLYDVRKACKAGAPICLFIDWRQYPSITDGRDGYGGERLCGTREIPVRRKDGSASRQSTSYGGATDQCQSAVRFPACRGCSVMGIRRTASM